jgi:hypothetical protein
MGKGEQKSTRYTARIEFAATLSKQMAATISNCNKIAPFRGLKIGQNGG